MTHVTQFLTRALLTLSTAIALSSCGGGGGGNGDSSTSTTLRGVASAGAPITDATITVLASNGSIYATTATTGNDGAFDFAIDTRAYPPPYLLKVTKASGQSAGSYYAFANTGSYAGILVTPITSATLALASNSHLEQAFSNNLIPANLTSANIMAALDKVFAAAQAVFTNLSVSDKNQLLSNANYSANGTGPDAALDALSFSSAAATDGSILVGSKLTGTSVLLQSSTTVGSITSLPFSANGASLLVALNTAIAQVNTCIKDTINNSSTAPDCLHANFLDAGRTRATFGPRLHQWVSQVNAIGAPSVRWCQFDNGSLSINSTALQLASATGVCSASFPISTAAGATVITFDYRFTLNAAGTGVASVKAYGNQLQDELRISPKILKKVRVDGFTSNTGVVSGYSFEIGTALANRDTNPTVAANSNLSAMVELLNSSGTVLDTFYMQCQQGSSCINSNLAVCKNKSATCASGVDTMADDIISVDSALAARIITALQTGPVLARITGYDKILSDGSKQPTIQKTLPVIGLPIAQEVASALSFPTLTSASTTTLASWAGGTSISLEYQAGDARISPMSLSFDVQPSAGITGQSKLITQGVRSVTFTGLTGTGRTVVPLTVSGCQSAQSQGYANWRASYITGSFANVPVEVKQFGSCNAGDY